MQTLNKQELLVPEIPLNIKEAKDSGFFACGTSQSGKTTLCKWLVKKVLDAGITVKVIDISKAWTVDTPLKKVYTVPVSYDNFSVPYDTSYVLDLSELPYAERGYIVNFFCKELYNWHKKFGYKAAPFGFIFFEEAHTYFPNGCFRSPKRFSAAIDIVTVGANFNLRFGAITQFPAMLDKALVKITQQRYFGWTTEYNDRNYIKSFVGKEHVDPKNLDSVFNLSKGNFLYQLRNNITKIKSAPYRNVESENCKDSVVWNKPDQQIFNFNYTYPGLG